MMIRSDCTLGEDATLPSIMHGRLDADRGCVAIGLREQRSSAAFAGRAIGSDGTNPRRDADISNDGPRQP